jgi:putative membrane-bound dehydrogenase-like protein
MAVTVRRRYQVITTIFLLASTGVPLALPVLLCVPLALPVPAYAAAPNPRDPQNAVAGLDVYPGLEATLFASEPTLTNPTNIDIDHRGRVWVCDVANYRSHAGERPGGDRILILEDTNGDGKSDKSTVYYQGKDLVSPMGICVLGNKVIVSASPHIFVFTDENGDDKPDKKEFLFTNVGAPQHDHSAHSFVFGPDGKLYWNFGNTGRQVCDKNGKIVVDKAGNEVRDNGRPYRQGMVFRCNLDGSEFEVLAHNFRNNYEVCVDSFGNIWQSDNDDDGNFATRIVYVMEGGNYGYVDEMSGASWQTPRTNLEKEVPRRHWHQNDPGVAPTMHITGAGSPSGICVYEGRLLPKPFHDQLLHCEPGHNVVRCYRVAKDGAGFKVTETLELLKGKRDNWFRPADVCVAPDGSVFVSDWYDPGVGGHNQADTKRGRIFRVAPKGKTYNPPRINPSTPEGAAQALANPCQACWHLGWTRVQRLDIEVAPALEPLLKSENFRMAARAIAAIAATQQPTPSDLIPGINADLPKEQQQQNPDADVVNIRLLRRASDEALASLQHDLIVNGAPDVRREAVLSLRNRKAANVSRIWAALAANHDGKDRWYLESLGIGAANKWDACLDAWLAKVGDKWNTPVGRDIIWRSRAKKTPEYLAKIIADPAVPTAELPRYFRAFDFQAEGEVKNAALLALVTSERSGDAARRHLIARESLNRLRGGDVKNDPRARAALTAVLDAMRGTPQFVELVTKFDLNDRFAELLVLAQNSPADQIGVTAIRALLARGATRLVSEGIAHQDPKIALATIEALGNSADNRAAPLLLPIVKDAKKNIELRKAAAKSLAKTKSGAEDILKMFKTKTIDAEVASGAAFVLNAAPWDNIRREAATLFPPPPSKDNRPLPPIDKLVERGGDANRGKQVFNKAGTCANCHKVASEGKEVGPDLSDIGAKLSRQALFESILFPSAGISHSYETFSVSTTDGNIISGVLVSRTPAEITIKDKDALVRAIKSNEVDEVKQQPVSLMPADLQKLMTVEELVDVVEYMTTLKKK